MLVNHTERLIFMTFSMSQSDPESDQNQSLKRHLVDQVQITLYYLSHHLFHQHISFSDLNTVNVSDLEMKQICK